MPDMPQAKTRVLFIEDDRGKRYVIARQLRAAGFDVDEATTGEEGLALLGPQHDLVLLDLRLPDMYGWDVCRRIKNDPRTSQTMVLELSATLATAEDRAKGLDLGADAYLVHPVEIIELVAVINSLVRLRRAVRSRDLERELFIATVGHDLRNPMAAVAYGLEVLKISQTITERDRLVLARVERNLVKMQRLTDQLLVFARSLAGGLSIERTRLDLRALCGHEVEDARTAVTDRKVELVVDAEPQIEGDTARLAQLLDNLLANAIRYGTGTVTLRLGRSTRSAVITVHNHGAPIPVDKLATLFDPFKPGSGQSGSFGLGLFIVDRIARAHGGQVSVVSSEENGTTFRVELPLAPGAADELPGSWVAHGGEERGAGRSEGELSLAGRRIVVVDDDPDGRAMITALLESLGANVTTASSADDGLAKVRAVLPDVLITDIGMPMKDGYQLMGELRLLPAAEGGATPAIAVSGFGTGHDRERSKRVGFQSHLTKPLDLGEVATVVRSLLARAERD